MFSAAPGWGQDRVPTTQQIQRNLELANRRLSIRSRHPRRPDPSHTLSFRLMWLFGFQRGIRPALNQLEENEGASRLSYRQPTLVNLTKFTYY